MTARTALAACLALALGAAPAGADPDEAERALSRTYYEFEVASYCGLVTEPVGAGFRRRVRRLLTAADLEPEAIDRLRGKAWQAAHAEWQNRGLGGFRGWCRTEGREAAERFTSEGP